MTSWASSWRIVSSATPTGPNPGRLNNPDRDGPVYETMDAVPAGLYSYTFHLEKEI